VVRTPSARFIEKMPRERVTPHGARTRLFHAIVGLGLASASAACGGSLSGGPKDGGVDGTSSDGAGFDASDETAVSFDAALVDTSVDVALFREAGEDALDAGHDADADAWTVIPVQ
jgi:hypothetical protein